MLGNLPTLNALDNLVRNIAVLKGGLNVRSDSFAEEDGFCRWSS